MKMKNGLTKNDLEARCKMNRHTTNSVLAAIFAMFKPLTKQEKRQAGIISASDYQKQKREEK
jgi:hypothetical protein